MSCPSLKTTTRVILRIVDASPIALLILIFSWSFWAYIFSLCYNLIKEDRKFQGFVCMLFYIPILFLCLFSYWQVCKTSPGYTTDAYKKSKDIEEDSLGLLSHMSNDHFQKPPDESIAMLGLEAHHTPIPITVKRDGAKRFCQKCKLDKFDRTHHCRSCKKCVLKMDHHCPWINNCVGFENHKAFYLFLVYASLYCVYVFSTTLPITIEQVNGPMSILGLNLNCGILVFISAIFGLFLVPFTIFHTRQLCKNRTTIEFYEKANYRLGNGSSRDVMRSKYFNPWDIGTSKNIEQVLGKGPLWHKLLPIGKPLGDGTTFPINGYAYDTLGTDEMDD